MVRATPTGVSAVIDAYGRPLARLGQGVKGVIDADLPAAAPSTLYRQIRDWPFWIVVISILATKTRSFNLHRNRVT